MSAVSTNLHFHGLTIPPVCHQDDVLKTLVEPGDAAFEYRFRIPDDEPPGLYWYHPHVHGFSKKQLLGGASGALIVEGIERAKGVLAGLPERVFVIRDQDMVNPNAPPAKSEPVVPKFLVDRDGDAANTGTGFGKPAKDLSINYVPVPYPDYAPAVIEMRPKERQLWRVLNAAAITYLNIEILFNHAPEPLGVVAMDGVPMSHDDPQGEMVSWQKHLVIPPGARVEFIVDGPAEGEDGLLVTRTVDTGPGGENDPNRMLAKIIAKADAPEPRSRLSSSPEPLAASATQWLGDVAPVRVRHLYFSEKLDNPDDPTSAIEFYLTEEGRQPKMFDMNSSEPNIVVQQGTVEDWIVENRSSELHDFHIHQLHFLLIDYMGKPVNEKFLRDTVNVPYNTGRSLSYPSVRLRMDFRDPNIVGTFVYHCHILEHEDKGMMGSIRVDPPAARNNQAKVATHEGNNSDAETPSRVAQRLVKSR
jgi:FtsP/CotA-like multicopper oxidase with cupredoxin domain